MNPNWIKLLYDKQIDLSLNERDQLCRMVQEGQIDPAQLELTLITLIIRSRRRFQQQQFPSDNCIKFPTSAVKTSSTRLLSLWGGHENQWLSDTMLISSIVIASFGVKVCLSPFPDRKKHYWRNSVDKIGLEFSAELNYWRFLRCHWMQEEPMMTEEDNYRLLQDFNMASSDYRSILYSGLLNPNVAFVHMMVSHPDYQQPAAELLSALSIVKGLVFPSNFLGGQYSHEFGAVKEINNSLILDCSYSINRFRSLFDDDFPFSNSGFHCEKTLIDAFFDGEINHRFGVDVILHAASALYVCDLFSSFNDASEAVVKSINAKKPKAVLKQLLSFNHSYIHRSAHQ